MAYQATAGLRARVRLKNRLPRRSRVGGTESHRLQLQCLRPSTAWTGFPREYTALQNGSSIEFYANSTKGKRGNAFDVDALMLASSAPSVPVPPADLAVSLTAPSAVELAGVVTLAASVTSGTAARVEFLADGQVVANDTTGSYSGTWDTATVTDGLDLPDRARRGQSGRDGGVRGTVGNRRQHGPRHHDHQWSLRHGRHQRGEFRIRGNRSRQRSSARMNGGAWTTCATPAGYATRERRRIASAYAPLTGSGTPTTRPPSKPGRERLHPDPDPDPDPDTDTDADAGDV